MLLSLPEAEHFALETEVVQILLPVFSGSGSKAKTSKESPKTPKQQQFSKLNNLTRATVKVNNQTQEAASQGQGQGQGEASGRKQLSLEDQQQLAELVQENMERNHVKQLR